MDLYDDWAEMNSVLTSLDPPTKKETKVPHLEIPSTSDDIHELLIKGSEYSYYIKEINDILNERSSSHNVERYNGNSKNTSERYKKIHGRRYVFAIVGNSK